MTLRLTRRSLVGASAAALSAPALLARAAGNGPAAASAPPVAAPGPVRLLANENPYGPSARAREAIAAATATAWQYPLLEAFALKKQIAAREGVPDAQVIVGDGSGELLRIAALMFTRERPGVVVAAPTFTFLQDYAKTLGRPVREVPLDSALRHDLPAMAAAVTADTGLVYVCNPNNPTGTLVPGTSLHPFLKAVAPRSPVVVDEAYLDLSDDAREHSAIGRVKAGDRVLVLRTFSKLHGLAGLRIGYGIGPADLVAQMELGRMSVLNGLGLAAATASLADEAFQAFSRARIREARELTQGTLASLGLKSTESRGNFVFFDTMRAPGEFARAMREAGFQVGRPFAPYTRWCRVSMGTVEQMQAFSGALRDYYGKP